MPSRKKGETARECMSRLMKIHTKKYKFKQALAISLKQCGQSKEKDAKDWEFIFRIEYKDKIKEEGDE